MIKQSQRAEIMCAVDLSVAAWCSLENESANFSIQDIYLNWNAFLNRA